MGDPHLNGVARDTRNRLRADHAEQVLVGRMMHAEDTDTVRTLVGLEDLCCSLARLVYQAASALRDSRLPVSWSTVFEWLRSQGQADYLGADPEGCLERLADLDPTGCDVHFMAERVQDAARARRLMSWLREAERDLADGASPPEDLAEQLRQKIGAIGAGKRSAPRFEWLDADEFFGADYRPEWLVPGILVRGQPGVIAGPSKSLKTSLLIDLAVSLASATPFLGQFDVPRSVRVAFASGESGRHTVQETALRVAAAKGVAPGSLKGRFRPCFTLPVLSDPSVMAEFSASLAAIEADVVVVDPLYMALGPDVDEKSMFQMGAVLRAVADLIQQTGRTFLIAHHTNGRLQTGEPAGLDHLAYAGGAQFFRQWLLLNRRERYAGNGIHDLWLAVGGSVGHGGLWGLHVEEGITGDHFNGRRWQVDVMTPDEIRADRDTGRETAKEEANRRKQLADGTKVLRAIDAERTAGFDAATQKAIQTRTGFSLTKLKAVVAGLIEDGAIEAIDFEKVAGNGSRRPVSGYRRLNTGNTGNTGDPDVPVPVFG